MKINDVGTSVPNLRFHGCKDTVYVVLGNVQFKLSAAQKGAFTGHCPIHMYTLNVHVYTCFVHANEQCTCTSLQVSDV